MRAPYAQQTQYFISLKHRHELVWYSHVHTISRPGLVCGVMTHGQLLGLYRHDRGTFRLSTQSTLLGRLARAKQRMHTWWPCRLLDLYSSAPLTLVFSICGVQAIGQPPIWD